MTKFGYKSFLSTLTITALAASVVLTPFTAVASEGNVKSIYNVQTTQSLVNSLTRLGGFDRYLTAVQIADHGWQSARAAVLAPSGNRNMVDALASSTLAKAIDGPLLLTDSNSIPSATMAELKKLGVTKVYIVSGTTVISANVESALLAAGIQSVRLGGYDRFETAVNIAKEIEKIKPYQEIVVTNSYSSADAVSIAPIAAAKGIPILLVNKDSIPTEVSDFIKSLGITKTYVIGGTAVISETVKDALPNAIRLGGTDRFDTNTAVLKQFKNHIAGGPIFFANGNDSSLIDSLAGAPMAAKLGGAIVLSNKETVPDGTKEFIRKDIALKNPGILGGTAVMSDSAVQSLGYTQPNQSATQNGAVEFNTPNATYKDETVNGNILVDADNETIENVDVKGTIFIDPGKDGTTTLDGVLADRIVILSGADHSIYLKGTQSENLVVSSSSDVHVVAETGTAIGSTFVQSDAIVESQSGANIGSLSVQSSQAQQINVQLQGIFSNDVNLSGSVKLTAATNAVIPKVNVSGALTPDSIQLEGQFPNVSISDYSSIDVLSGKIEQLETKGTTSIVVENGAEITNLVSDGGTVTVSGGGIVNGKTSTDIPTEVGSIPSTSTTSGGGRDRDRVQAVQPVITGTIRAGETTISGTAELGATVSVAKDGEEIGTATTDGTGSYTVTLNEGVSAGDTLSITATAPGETTSSAISVTVIAAETQTKPPAITGTVSDGDKTMSGTAAPGATVIVMRNVVVLGTATADENGNYTITLYDGVTLSVGDTLSITATTPGETTSSAISVTVIAAETQTTPPAITGTVSAGETMILGTAQSGATVSVMRDAVKIGTATVGTSGYYMVNLTGVTLTQGGVLLITATAPGKAESSAASVTVAAALPKTKQPNVPGTIMAGGMMISGNTDPGATVCIMRSQDETMVGISTADATGAFNVTVENGVILAEGDVLLMYAKAPDKAFSDATSITVVALAQSTTPQAISPTITTSDTTTYTTTGPTSSVSSDNTSTIKENYVTGMYMRLKQIFEVKQDKKIARVENAWRYYRE